MSVVTDVRLAARLLLKERWFTAAATSALALGIGANVVAFTLLNGVLLRELPFHEPDRLVAIEARDLANGRQWNMSHLDLRDVQEAALRTASGVGAVRQGSVAIGDSYGDTERLTGAYISAGTFDVLGVRPLLGRDIAPDDDRHGAEPVAILGHNLWSRRYGGDPSLLGRRIRINGVTTTVIGVMADGFGFPETAEVWQPMALMSAPLRERRDVRSLDAFARLAPGASIQQLATEVNGVMTSLGVVHPDTNRGIDVSVIPYREAVVGRRAVEMFSTVMGAVGLLLLIACANVANLLLARTGSRAQEIAIRGALGAGRWIIVRQLLAESLVLAGAAGVIGLALGAAGVRLFAAYFSEAVTPYWLSFPLDLTVVGFVVAVCLGTALLFGLVPALHASRLRLGDTLTDAARSTTGTRERRWNGTFVVAQVALALVMVTAGALLVRAAVAHLNRDAGIDTTGLLAMRVELPPQRYPTPDHRAAFYRALDDRLATLPRARSAIATPGPRMGGPERWILIDGRPGNEVRRRPRVTTVAIGRRYFDTLGVAVRSGRLFTDLDTGQRVVLVNERFAELHFAGQSAVGRQIELGPDGPESASTGLLTIVGVVPNVRQNDEEETAFDPVAYLPATAGPLPNAMILARSQIGSASVTAGVRAILSDLDPDLPLFDVSSLDDALAADAWPLRIFGSMFGTLAVSALFLAAVGIYAVSTYAVARRTREIGLRLALGAQRRHVWWTVSRRVAIQSAIGIAIGLVGALAAGEILASVIAGVRPRDPLTLVLVPGLLFLVALAACLPPMRRALHLNPVDTLRAE
jgi:putative ABC transport system permease protein